MNDIDADQAHDQRDQGKGRRNSVPHAEFFITKAISRRYGGGTARSGNAERGARGGHFALAQRLHARRAQALVNVVREVVGFVRQAGRNAQPKTVLSQLIRQLILVLLPKTPFVQRVQCVRLQRI